MVTLTRHITTPITRLITTPITGKVASVSPFNPVTLGLLAQFAGFQEGKIKAELVTVTGPEEVDAWIDFNSGSSRNVIQTIPANKLIYTPSGLNGHPALACDGINDVLTNTSFPNILSVSMFVVGEYESGFGDQGMLDISDGSTNTGASFFYSGTTSNFRTNSILGLKTADFTESLPAKHIFTGTAGTSSDMKYYIDGDLKDTVVSGTITNTLNRLDIGQLANTPTFTLKGMIGEVIIYDRVLSDIERNAVTVYLSAKWGIALI